MLREQMTILILSCDKFSDLWDGQIKQLEKNWPDRDMETFVVTDAPTDRHYEGIRILSAGTEPEWSDRLAFALREVKTPYVFLTLDDYFLIEPVSTAQIETLVETMEAQKLDYLRLFPRPKSATLEELPGCKGIRRVDTTKNYSVNLYAGIWKREFAEYTVAKPLNAWRFEVSLPKRALDYGASCAVCTDKVYQILDVVRKGKLLHKSAAYFRKHPGIYEGDRETNTWSFEAKLWCKTMAGRHAPKPVKNALKKFLRKRGHTFFTDESGL